MYEELKQPRETCYEFTVGSFTDFDPICGLAKVYTKYDGQKCVQCDLSFLVENYGTALECNNCGVVHEENDSCVNLN